MRIQPTFKDLYQHGTAVTSEVITTWGTAVDATGYNTADFDTYRITGFCVEYTAHTSPSESQGLVIGAITPVEADAGAVTDDWDMNSSLISERMSVSQYQANLCLCAKPFSESSKQFIKYNDFPDGRNIGWPFIYIGIKGGDTTSVQKFGEVTITLSVEFRVDVDSVYNLMLHQPTPSLPQLEAAISNAYNASPAIVDGSDNPREKKKSFWDVAEEAALSLVDSLGDVALATLIGLL
jgi:hypothetical protein